DALHLGNAVARIPQFGIARVLLLQARHRHFCQVVEHQVVDLATLDLTDRSLDPVAPESLPCGDSDCLALLHCRDPSPGCSRTSLVQGSCFSSIATTVTSG